MRIFRGLGYLALAFALSTAFVGCNNDDSQTNGEVQTITYQNSTVIFNSECSGNFYRLVDITPEVLINGVKSDKFTDFYDGNNLQVVINEVLPFSTVTVNINVKRNKTPLSDFMFINLMLSPQFIVNRNFSDGTVVPGGATEFKIVSEPAIDKDKLDEYIKTNGSKSYSIQLNESGSLKK